jgi:hypothetical protein
MTSRSGGVHFMPNTVVCDAVGTADASISQLGNEAIYG